MRTDRAGLGIKGAGIDASDTYRSATRKTYLARWENMQQEEEQQHRPADE